MIEIYSVKKTMPNLKSTETLRPIIMININ